MFGGVFMTRVFGHILVLAALLVQLRTGALPSDQMCLNFGDARPTCTCCGKKAHSVATKSCCRTEGCERCVRVPAPERQAAPAAKARTVKTSDMTVSLAAAPVAAWKLQPTTLVQTVHCLADESPPNLVAVTSTRLLL